MNSSPPSHVSQDILILEPGRTEKNYWSDLWRYRELFLILSWRDISVRYKQTIIGILWAIIRPFLTMVIVHAFSHDLIASHSRSPIFQWALTFHRQKQHFNP